MATAIDTSKETHADVAAAEVLRRFAGYYKPYKALFLSLIHILTCGAGLMTARQRASNL